MNALQRILSIAGGGAVVRLWDGGTEPDWLVDLRGTQWDRKAGEFVHDTRVAKVAGKAKLLLESSPNKRVVYVYRMDETIAYFQQS